ncbi:P-loop NTPase fold protein [Candidatus Tisiphia endosymbiont of Metellina segmentata]|uniref:P-loop NTPase fold protein n=1 Tax=Candidatus Tisiphia endosymbiont of Metellina segmentata TaxID=3066274 RepID=UPI00313C2064
MNPITEIIEIVVLGIGIGVGVGVWRCWDTVFAFLAEHIATNVVVYKVYSLLFPKNSFVLVFDDLERSTIPIEELLGYINYFVEQQKVKTIIIANTEQIVNRYPKNQEKDKQLGTFNIIKEKIISITFPLTADVDDIVITILNQVEAEELKKKLLDLADHIIKIFNQADYKNFRSLEHSILSFQRLYRDALKHCDNINDNKFRTILETFLILSLEHHYSDKLETKLWSNMTNDDAKNGEKSFYDKYKKYLCQLIYKSYLSREIWANIIFKNKIECEKIKTELNTALYRLLRYYSNPLDDDTFNRLINEVKSDLKATKVEEEGKVKHIISLLMHFQKKGKIEIININEYIGYAKKNLEKIYNNLAYETLNKMHKNFYDQFTKYLYDCGHAFHSEDDDDFKKFIDECQEIRQTVINCKKRNIEAKTKSDN